MGSVDKSAAGKRNPCRDNDNDVATEGALLLTQYGPQADTIAAYRAESSFRSGDTAAGKWWLRVFRSLALDRPPK